MYIFNFYITLGFFWKILIVLTTSAISGFILSIAYQIGNKKNQQLSQPYSWLILVMPSMIAIIIFMVEDNFLRAVYLLGATTLIRFRNPVKNPLTTIFVLATVGTGACAGFGLYTGSIVLALMCLLIIWVSCYWSTAGRGVNRILYLDCHYSHQPETILKELGTYVKKWSLLSLETSPAEDRLYYSYDVELCGEHEHTTLINRFKSAGIKAHIIEPRGVEEF
jgi:uncharacterized membrane protein